MELLTPDYQNILFVLENLREQDRLECEAFTGQPPGPFLAEHYEKQATSDLLFEVAGDDRGLPVAVYGFSLLTPFVLQAHLLATDDFRKIAPKVTRRGRRHILPALKARGFRRIEARALLDNQGACLWLELLGAKPECVMPIGARGEAFVQYALTWEASDVLRTEAPENRHF